MARVKILAFLVSTLMICSIGFTGLYIHTNKGIVNAGSIYITNCTQEKSVVEYLGIDHFSSSDGHNNITASFNTSVIDYCYIEMNYSGDGQGWVAMKDFDNASEFTNMSLVNNHTGLSVRESVDADDYNGYTLMVFSCHDDVGTGANQVIYRMNGTNMTYFSNKVIAINESDNLDEDVSIIQIGNATYAMSEDNDYDQIELHRSYDQGFTWTNLQSAWDPTATDVDPESPHQFVWNDKYYCTGESWGVYEYPGGVQNGYCYVSNDLNPENISSVYEIGNCSDYASIDRHFALKAVFIDRDGVCHGYINGEKSSVFKQWYVNSTNTSGNPGGPWGDWTEIAVGESFTMPKLIPQFNYFLAYGTYSHNSIQVYELTTANVETHSFSPSGWQNWTYEFYQPCCYNGSTIQWRMVGVDGVTEYRSDIYNFTIGTGGASPPSSYNPPNITSMGYSGCYNHTNMSVMVGTFYVNFSYDTNGTPSYFWLNISNDTGFSSLVKNVNITGGWTDGYCNESISTGVAASTSKYYVHVRGFYD